MKQKKQPNKWEQAKKKQRKLRLIYKEKKQMFCKNYISFFKVLLKCLRFFYILFPPKKT